jgi:hypothetical protein
VGDTGHGRGRGRARPSVARARRMAPVARRCYRCGAATSDGRGPAHRATNRPRRPVVDAAFPRSDAPGAWAPTSQPQVSVAPPAAPYLARSACAVSVGAARHGRGAAELAAATTCVGAGRAISLGFRPARWWGRRPRTGPPGGGGGGGSAVDFPWAVSGGATADRGNRSPLRCLHAGGSCSSAR